MSLLAAALPALGSALGGLGSALGGGTKIRQTTLTGTNSLQNSFAPTNAVTFGGDFAATPYAPVSGNPNTQAVPTLPAQGQETFIPQISSGANGGLFSGPVPLIAAGVIALIVFTKDK